MCFSPSIKSAFKNGSGDVCFKNELGFVFVSRHSDFKDMETLGCEYVPYEKVLQIDKEQNPEPKTFIEKVERAKEAPVNFHYQGDSYTDQFYMEYPDAYGQNL